MLVTIGTGRLTEIEEDSMGLAGEHDYAVIAMKIVDQRKLLLIKNPWAEGTIWKGDATYGPLGTSQDYSPSMSMNTDGTPVAPLKSGTFWMDLDDVYQSFESIYLNWNPGLFSYREDNHFSWDLANTNSEADSFRANPQYEVVSSTGSTAWLLLSRHFRSRPEKVVNSRAEADERGYISLYAYANNGYRVFRSDGALVRGHYVDSPNTLLKLELRAGISYTIVVSQQALPRSSFNFTLSTFSMEPLAVREAKERYKYHTLQHGAWTHATSGGNVSSADYHVNPQYSVRLMERSDISLLLETGNESLPVHVKLLWSGGNPVRSTKSRDIIGDSGEYQKGYAFAEIPNIEAGKYTIVCSTFESGQRGHFSLRVGSMSECVVHRLPAAADGRLISRIGTALFSHNNDRLLAPLMVGRITRLFMTARWDMRAVRAAQSPHSPLKLALEYGQGPTKQILTASGADEFVDSRFGIRTPDVDVQPGMCQGRGLWVVIERLGRPGLQQDDESIEIEVLGDAPIEVGHWSTG